MQAGVGVLGVEAEHVAVGDVVGDGGEIAFELFGFGEVEVFAAGHAGYGFGNVGLHAVDGGDGGHLCEGQRRG